MQKNLEVVQKGFRILHPMMAGYIGMEMSRAYHNNWWNEVLNALSDQWDLPAAGNYDELIDSLDVANCLRLIDRKWSDIFRNRLDINHRTWAKELMGVRNTVAHIGQKDLTQSDAERALDTMARLCDVFDVEGAEEIRKLYRIIRYTSDTSCKNQPNEGPSPIDVPVVAVLGNALDISQPVNLLRLIGTDVVQKTTLTRKVTFAGKTQAYPVYKIRLDALYYNDLNDRISTWISRYRSEYGTDSLQTLGGTEYNSVIENFIVASNPESIQKTQKNINVVGQREPGVVLADGRIVDGNRRFTCLRRIYRESRTLVYFEAVIMDVDIQRDRKQIKLLELALQHGEEKKVDYDPIDYAVGTYNDIVKTKLLTLEEYASSTNEGVADVKKRIEMADLICEFLRYIRLPEQYHVAREFQVHDLFKEMMPSLRQLSTDERSQLKNIVFNNILLKTLLDQRKFIRDIKLMIKNDTYTMYFESQVSLNKRIHDKFDEITVRSKDDIDDFAKNNEGLAEELQLSLQRALLRSRRQQLKSKPAENIAKSVSLMTEFDGRMLEKMDQDEKHALMKDMNQLSAVIARYTAVLNDGDVEPANDTEATTQQNTRYRLPSISINTPVLLCENAPKQLSTQNFGLCFRMVKENASQPNEQKYTLFFIDEENKVVSNAFELRAKIADTNNCAFVLDTSTATKSKAFLVIKPDGLLEDEAQRIIPFELAIKKTVYNTILDAHLST